jgi:hypothetical protein
MIMWVPIMSSPHATWKYSWIRPPSDRGLGILMDPAAETVWVPIIRPCGSGSMPILVEGAAEPVPSADIQLRNPLRTGNRLG